MPKFTAKVAGTLPDQQYIHPGQSVVLDKDPGYEWLVPAEKYFEDNRPQMAATPGADSFAKTDSSAFPAASSDGYQANTDAIIKGEQTRDGLTKTEDGVVDNRTETKPPSVLPEGNNPFTADMTNGPLDTLTTQPAPAPVQAPHNSDEDYRATITGQRLDDPNNGVTLEPKGTGDQDVI